jgi:hypothetical protein
MYILFILPIFLMSRLLDIIPHCQRKSGARSINVGLCKQGLSYVLTISLFSNDIAITTKS